MKNIYIVGVSGVGMSAIASICLDKQMKVVGSDAIRNKYTENLINRGLEFVKDLSFTQKIDAVICSSAIAKHHPDRLKAKEKGIPIFSRKQFMQFLMHGHSSLLVSGCHGKTTTSALVAHLLHYCGVEPSYCIGGTVPSLERHGLWKPTDYFVAEADESDGTFLELPCDHLIITNTSIDHLDYWKDEKELKKAYTERINSVKTQNRILCAQDPFLKDYFEGIFYGWSSSLAINAQNISTTATGMQFDLHYYGECFQKVQLPLMGKHNILNSLAAIAMCANTGVSVQKLLEALSHFRGIERRMHLIGENDGATIIDDYAHHPNEITASLEALRNHYPNHQLVVIFQPHKYSRIKENISQFKTCFSHADTLIITSIFAAGESLSEYPNLLNQLIETIDQKVTFIPFEKIQSSIDLYFQPKTIIVTMGAGDITSVGKSLTHAY